MRKIPCDHSKLTFGSGGYYIFCKICSKMWAAVKGQPHEFDTDRQTRLAGTGDFEFKENK